MGYEFIWRTVFKSFRCFWWKLNCHLFFSPWTLWAGPSVKIQAGLGFANHLPPRRFLQYLHCSPYASSFEDPSVDRQTPNRSDARALSFRLIPGSLYSPSFWTAALSVTILPLSILLINSEICNNMKMDYEIKNFKIFHCEKCDKFFESATLLAVHNRKHTNERLYTCEAEGCVKMFLTNSALKSHTLLKHAVEKKTHGSKKINCSCTNCMAAGQIKGPGSFLLHNCHLCDKVFLYPSLLSNHLKIHDGVRPYACNRTGCEETFFTKALLKKHVRSHAGYLCATCGCLFSRRSVLDEHIALETQQQLAREQKNQTKFWRPWVWLYFCEKYDYHSTVLLLSLFMYQ